MPSTRTIETTQPCVPQRAAWCQHSFASKAIRASKAGNVPNRPDPMRNNAVTLDVIPTSAAERTRAVSFWQTRIQACQCSSDAAGIRLLFWHITKVNLRAEHVGLRGKADVPHYTRRCHLMTQSGRSGADGRLRGGRSSSALAADHEIAPGSYFVRCVLAARLTNTWKGDGEAAAAAGRIRPCRECTLQLRHER
jgi:hypothetical protein